MHHTLLPPFTHACSSPFICSPLPSPSPLFPHLVQMNGTTLSLTYIRYPQPLNYTSAEAFCHSVGMALAGYGTDYVGTNDEMDPQVSHGDVGGSTGESWWCRWVNR